jgi:hypothetical protein
MSVDQLLGPPPPLQVVLRPSLSVTIRDVKPSVKLRCRPTRRNPSTCTARLFSKTPTSHSLAIALAAVSLALAITACGSSSTSSGATTSSSAAHANGYVYWASNQTIGRASLNGTSVNQRFITGVSRPHMIAITSRYSDAPDR